MNSKKEVQHVYLVGAKSLGAYGGYETFVYKLTEYHQNKENIKYHVACKANGDGCMDESKFDGVTKINEHEFELHNVPSRNNSRVARAPQSFWLDDILSAHEKMLTKGITNCIDSCTMMQECGFNLHLVDGPGENIKITTPEDFYTMRAILEAKENAQIYGFDE